MFWKVTVLPLEEMSTLPYAVSVGGVDHRRDGLPGQLHEPAGLPGELDGKAALKGWIVASGYPRGRLAIR
jgi:hypothetical protein